MMAGGLDAWDFGRKGVLAAALYDGYRTFCVANGYAPVARTKFESEIIWYVPRCRRGQAIGAAGKLVSTILGLRRKPHTVTKRATRGRSGRATRAAAPARLVEQKRAGQEVGALAL